MYHRSVIVICFHNALWHMLYTVQSNLFIAAILVLAWCLNIQCFSSLECPLGCVYCEFVALSETPKCTLLGCDSHYYQVASMDCKGMLCFQCEWFVYILSNLHLKAPTNTCTHTLVPTRTRTCHTHMHTHSHTYTHTHSHMPTHSHA